MITEQDFLEASEKIGCEIAVIKAVAKVEAPKGGFLPSGKPVILFEGHVFSNLTNHKYDQSYPEISYPKWTKEFYLGDEDEYGRLNIAKSLDEIAALKSTSWGKFQIMGFNYRSCNYAYIHDLISDMYTSEQRHLLAFTAFLISTGLNKHLKNKDWVKFAYGYNGKGYAKNQYDVKLLSAYEKLAEEAT